MLELRPGMSFFFKSRRHLFIVDNHPPGVGQILDLFGDEVMLIRLFWNINHPNLTGLDLVSVGFLPIRKETFISSLREFTGVADLGSDWQEALELWKERYMATEASVFQIPIFEAQEKAWNTALTGNESTNSPLCYHLEYAFPVKDINGKFRKIEVGVMTKPRICVPPEIEHALKHQIHHGV